MPRHNWCSILINELIVYSDRGKVHSLNDKVLIILLATSQFAPAAAFMHLFPSLIVSLYLVVPGDFCPDTSTAAKDPSLSHYLS